MKRLAALASLLALAATASAQDTRVEGAVAGAGLVLDSLQPAEQSKVRFSGLKTFTEDEVRAAIAEHVREIDERGVSPALADDAAYFVGAFYRKNGFADVQTDYSIAGGVVTLKVVEGPRTLLRGVDFTGNRAFEDAKLWEYMVGATPDELAKSPELFPFNASEIAAGADRVRGFYMSEGWLDATAEATSKLSRDGTGAEVTVKIVEGPRYTFGALRFEGETVFPQPKLIAEMKERPDGPFSRTKIIAMQRNLESFYRSQGYILAEVEVDADPALAQRSGAGRFNSGALVRPQPRRGQPTPPPLPAGTTLEVPITFTIAAGAQHRFDGVQVKNVTEPHGRLRESFMPRRFRHLAGQVYDPAKVDEVYRELLRTGLFTNLRFTPTPLPDQTVRLDFEIDEAKSKEVGFTAGFGTYDGMKLGLRLADRNLLGNGRPLSLSIDYSQRGYTGDLTYVDPWFLDHPRMNARAKIYGVDREEKGYRKEEAGYRADLGWRAMPHLEVGAFAQGSSVQITESTIDPLFLGPTDYSFLSVGVMQTTDFRNNPMVPTRGWMITTSFDVATVDGGQSFTRSVARFSWYRPIGKMQLALGARVGAIQPIAPSIPIDARFFNGGATSVRSFAERELGPKDEAGNPLGGEFYTVFNAELTFPLGFAGLQGAVFFDAGNLRSWHDRGVEDLRYAAGLGLRYPLPVGALRLDYGINPDRREDEDFGAFHLSFGVAF